MKLPALAIVGLLTAFAVGQGVPAGPRKRQQFQLNPNVPEVLKRAFAAQNRLTFHGRRVVTIRREGVTSTFEDLVWHESKFTRIEFPPGSTRAGQIIVETKGERRHYFPEDNEIEVSTRRGGPGEGGIPGGGLGMLSRRPEARFTLGGLDNVAAVSCQIVDGEGPFGGKVRLWIDPQSAMVLKRENYDRQGAIVAGFEFKSISIGDPIPDSIFTINVPGAKTVTIFERLQRSARKHGFELLKLMDSSPFVLDGGRYVKTAGKESFVQMFSGPGGRFSLFQVKGTVDPAELQRKARGLHSLTWTRNGETLALVGDVDEGTLGSVAQQFGKP